MTLKKYKPKKIVILSRDEMKQWEMAQKFEGDHRVKFVIGDVRDQAHLSRTLNGIDYVVHAAATRSFLLQSTIHLNVLKLILMVLLI